MLENIKTNKKMWIYGTIILIAVLVVGVILQNKVFVKQPEEGQQKQEIKIAQVPLAFITSFPLAVAQKEGFFDKYNLTVRFEQMRPVLSLQALLAKEVDYIPFAKTGTTASQKGLAVKTIILFSENPSYYLVGRPGLELKDLKTIAVSSRLVPMHYLALKVIDENDLPAEIVFSGESPVTSKVLLTKGRVDAAIIPIPTAFQLREEGLTLLKFFDDEIAQGLVTNDDKIRNNPEEVEKIVKAVQLAIEFIKTNPQETKELLFEFYNLERNEINEKIVEETYSIANQVFLDKGIPKGTGVNKLIQLAKAGNFESFEDIENQTITLEDVAKSFDFRFLNE